MQPVVVSEGFCELFGFVDLKQAYIALNEDSFSIIHLSDVERIRGEILRFLSEEGRYDVIYRSRPREGYESRLVRSEVKFVHEDDDVILAHIWYMDESSDVNKKIMELQESVTALLTNMPAMTFSKDVNTRKYLACNQAFVEYAHKESPEGVAGLTDFDIFDAETAEHFTQDDNKALTMDKPYVFLRMCQTQLGTQEDSRLQS